MPFLCQQCGLKCRDNYNLNRHQSSCMQQSGSAPKFNCFYCPKMYTRKDNLISHVKARHDVEKPKPANLQCPLCCRRFSDKMEIDTHFSQDHQIALEKLQLSFENQDSFYKWKSDMENSSGSRFVLRGRHRTKSYYFRCFRSICRKMNPLKSLQKLPSDTRKISEFCPARIKMSNSEAGTVDVVYCSTHVGHDFEVPRRVRKTKLSDLSVEKEEVKMDCCKQIQECTELTDGFDISENVIHHSNDSSSSVEAWIRQYQASDSLWVRYHKIQGEFDPNHTELQLDDFVLILMNNAQVELLKQFGNIICVDGTHRTNGYGFELTMMFVLNSRNDGLPVATMFSSRSDTQMMSIFFNYIRKLSGKINCKVFLTDTTDTYFQAWSKTMGTPERRFFGSWRVDEDWKINLNTIKGDETLKALVYKNIKMVQMERDVCEFETMFDYLISDLLNDISIYSFREYIRVNYGNTAQNWAYCHRHNVGIDTNIQMERMHNIFKYFYLKGKKTKRLDEALDDLAAFIQSKLYDELVSLHEGDSSKKLKNLRRAHSVYCEESNKMKVLQLDNGGFVVSSSTNEFNVLQVQHSCEECSLKCESCNTCYYSYVCTCLDNTIRGNMCKHIHKVCHKIKKQPGRDLIDNSCQRKLCK